MHGTLISFEVIPLTKTCIQQLSVYMSRKRAVEA